MGGGHGERGRDILFHTLAERGVLLERSVLICLIYIIVFFAARVPPSASELRAKQRLVFPAKNIIVRDVAENPQYPLIGQNLFSIVISKLISNRRIAINACSGSDDALGDGYQCPLRTGTVKRWRPLIEVGIKGDDTRYCLYSGSSSSILIVNPDHQWCVDGWDTSWESGSFSNSEHPSTLLIASCSNAGIQRSFTLLSARFKRLLRIVGHPLLLSDHSFGGLADFVSGGEHVRHFLSLSVSGLGQSVGIKSTFVHLPELILQYPDRESASRSQYERKNSHPDRRHGSATRSLIGGCLVLLFGSSLVRLAFYIADEPDPPILTMCLYYGVGIAAFAFMFQGIYLIVKLL